MAKAKTVPDRGRYEGAPPVVVFLDDGRLVKLVKPFAYISVQGRAWRVPKDAIVDGASIPRALWSLIGGPFEGRYRNASIIHDWFCDVRTRAWQDVHKVFYEALLASGVSRSRAMLMYAAVRRFGPRWSATVVANSRLARKDRYVAFLGATDRDISLKDGERVVLERWLGLSSTDWAIPDDRRRVVRPDSSGRASDAYTLRFNRADLDQLAQSVSSRDLTLDEVDAIVDSQALSRYQKSARRGQAATFRQAYS